MPKLSPKMLEIADQALAEIYRQEDLRKRQEKRYAPTRIGQFLCRSYALARSLGFSAQEAQILQNNSEETIRRLADDGNSDIKS